MRNFCYDFLIWTTVHCQGSHLNPGVVFGIRQKPEKVDNGPALRETVFDEGLPPPSFGLMR